MLGTTWSIVDLFDDAEAGVIDAGLAAVIAALALALILIGLHLVLERTNSELPPEGTPERTRRLSTVRGIKSLVIGKDGRASTSKWQAVLWTFAVIYVFAFMLVWGRSSDCGSEQPKSRACVEAEEGRDAFRKLINTDLQPEYYVLLGFPITAALAAKALTTNKVLNGTLDKAPIEPDTDDGILQGAERDCRQRQRRGRPPRRAVLCVHPADPGVLRARNSSADQSAGCPTCPRPCVALLGLSAAAYTTKKALETNVTAVIKDVLPKPLRVVEDQVVTLIGTGFGQIQPQPDDDDLGGPGTVYLGDTALIASSWTATRVSKSS